VVNVFIWLTTGKDNMWLVNAAYIFSVREEMGKTIVKFSDGDEQDVKETQSEIALMLRLAK
jgi:Ser/Thr protein kinase RdoA (MazF antagonist)